MSQDVDTVQYGILTIHNCDRRRDHNRDVAPNTCADALARAQRTCMLADTVHTILDILPFVLSKSWLKFPFLESPHSHISIGP